MIHSLSGGVIADNGLHRFAKVRLSGGGMGWYLAPFGAAAGQRALVPAEKGTEEGVIERIEYCTSQTAPIPIRRAREILSLLTENP